MNLEPTRNRWDALLYENKHAFVWQYGASLIELLAPQKGERILDLGCGTGQLTAQIAESGAEVIGIDNSSAMIDEARRLHPHLRFDLKDAHDFQYDQPFDGLFSNAALHWIERPNAVARCMNAALKPGGRAVVEFGGKGNVRHIAGALQAASGSILGKPIEHQWYFPSVGEFASVMENAGLEVTQAMLFDRPTPLEGDDGLRNWVKMFGGRWLEQIPSERHDEFFEQVESITRPDLYDDDSWHADYRRLRVVVFRVDFPRVKAR